ncbi:hypothetical protein GCM10022224_095910 [Nonomuraea antimicrobica]|uniref:N-acetyltransferase domain-containing protein n=1 Tax=Nonomuraea antimicrobica TaxID=561173 RepID=A0ABP7E8U9_9ACTN
MIDAGPLTLRPFTSGDIPWVYEVSQDPALRHFVDVPTPYLREHAAYFVEELAVGGRPDGRRQEFLAEDSTAHERLGRVGLGLREDGTAEIGFSVDPRARGRGVATRAVRAACRWPGDATCGDGPSGGGQG